MTSGACDLCGRVFTNVFDAVEHSQRSGEKAFSPDWILGGMNGSVRIRLGVLLQQLYRLSKDKAVKDGVEKAFALAYIAEMRQENIYEIFCELGRTEGTANELDVRQIVYDIVSEEVLEEVGLF